MSKKNGYTLLIILLVILIFTGCPPETPLEESSYTVQHWQQNIYDDEYKLVNADSETLKGTVGNKTEAQAKNYEGFEVKTFDQEKIVSGGSTIVNIYYNRKKFYITLNPGEGKLTSDGILDNQKRLSGRYEEKVPSVNVISNDSSMEFAGWLNENGEEESLPEIFTENRTFFAKYSELDISCEAAKMNVNTNKIQDIELTFTFVNNSSIRITADDDFKNFVWSVNGVLQNCNERILILEKDGSDIYNIQVVAEKQENSLIVSKNVIISAE